MRALTVPLAIGVLCAAVTVTAQLPSPPEGVALAEENLPPPVVLVLDPQPQWFRIPAPPSAAERDTPLAATITVNFLPAGSRDPRNELCYTWPAAAQTAMNYAASIWATLVNSNVPIVINACWADLELGILGYSGAAAFYRNFTGAPVADTWYPVSLANARYGSDLDPANPDIRISYNKYYYENGTLYLGTDGNPGDGQLDFVTIVLHEITHGLGFLGSMDVEGSLGSWGGGTPYPIAYDRFGEDLNGDDLINTAVFPNPSAELADALTSEAVYFNGVYADAANGGQRVKLFAPATWSGGSSFSHLDEIFNGTPHALMTYSIPMDEAIHSPGTITMGLLWDVGWTLLTHPLTVVKAGSGSGTVTSSPAGIDCGSDCAESFNWGTVVTLTAAASGGSTFAGWSGAGCSGTGTCQVTMDAARTVTATFTGSQPTLTVVKEGSGSGTVTSSPPGIDCGATCSASFTLNTVVTLTAVASAGSTFAGWSGSGCSGTATCVVTMDAAKSVSATFTATTHALTVLKPGT
ncbi:MAG: InlB B-repeat-containing protein, partial [Acidobacteriota bacterium]